jgi:hypothetical protein
MPAAGPIKQNSVQFLDGTNTPAQDLARAAVDGASSVREAVERVNLLAGEEESIVREAFAVLGGLPEAIDRGLLATLRSALGRRIPVEVDWEEGEHISFRVTEVVSPPRVDIVLITPHGSTYVN